MPGAKNVEEKLQPGIGVDADGGGVIDPTKNVLDLVRAESKYQDSMREALEKFQNAMRDTIRDQQNLARAHDTKFQDYARESQEKLQNWMRDAELKRVDEISTVRETYEKRIADMLAESVRSTSTLVSSQLVQIQATFNDRVSKLEEFRWSTAGRSSVADPARDEAMDRMAKTVAAQGEMTSAMMAKMGDANSEAISKLALSLRAVERSETSSSARGMGRGEIVSYITMGIMLLANIAVVLTFVLRH